VRVKKIHRNLQLGMALKMVMRRLKRMDLKMRLNMMKKRRKK
jgi:hypothetical protein